MRTIKATTVINAPLAAVWRVLGDGQQYAEWNPFITVVSGDLTPGVATDAADHSTRQARLDLPSASHPRVR